ncbi:MAG TPA: amidohydrolase family protein [Streptosporangiaceae bacterium]|nr:amidohydrolase family protein [Streptosporangiaceae bacterium]
MPSDVVDAHVHLLPSRLQAAIRGFFDARGIDSRGFAYPADHGEVCSRLAAEGVTEAWTLPYARRPGSAADLNSAVAEIVAVQRGGAVRLVGGCTVHPADDQPVTLLRRAVEDLGLRVLKLHCSVGEFTPDDRRLDPVWEYASAVALPVVLHAGHAADGHTAAAELEPVEVVARRHPGARVIIAHCGHAAATAALGLVARHANVHADLTPVIHERVQPPPAQLAELADKLLFGSDAPNTGLTATQLLDGLAHPDVPGTARAAITGGTARRLIREVRA